MNPKEKTLLILLASTLFLGLALSIISALGLCSSACQSSHMWRLFHLPFEWIGTPFFLFLPTLFALSRTSMPFMYLLGISLSAAVGAELWMLTVQKMIIQHWCPVCLSIAATVFSSAILFSLIFFIFFLNKEDQMKKLKYSLLSLLFVISGFLLTFSGTSKISPERVDEDAIKNKIAFGNASSKVEIYIFTDWLCPACRQVEGTLEKILDQLGGKARIIFADLPVHRESINFTPVNLYIMINQKDRYFPLRKAFENLASGNAAPSDMDFRRVFGSFGVSYQPLSFSQISSGTMYFKRLAKDFTIDSTPTVVVINSSTKEGKKFKGAREITVENISKAVNNLS